MKNSFVEMFFGASPVIFEKAKLLREKMTNAEKILWDRLKNNQRKGFHFRRQHPVSQFVVDFYCHKARLAVEADGGIHLRKEQGEHDEQRTFVIENFGIKILRFTNSEIENNLEEVIKEIDHCLSLINESKTGRL